MADFDKAIKLILKNEGGFVSDPDDMGGATKYGISLRFLKSLGDLGDIDGDGDIDSDDIKSLSLITAWAIYQREWWDRYEYSEIKDDDLASKIFDMSVNMGPQTAHKLVQKAINLNNNMNIKEDGILGRQTKDILNSIEKEYILNRLRGVVCEYYMGLVRKNEAQKKFIDGWLRRGLK